MITHPIRPHYMKQKKVDNTHGFLKSHIRSQIQKMERSTNWTPTEYTTYLPSEDITHITLH